MTGLPRAVAPTLPSLRLELLMTVGMRGEFDLTDHVASPVPKNFLLVIDLLGAVSVK